MTDAVRTRFRLRALSLLLGATAAFWMAGCTSCGMVAPEEDAGADVPTDAGADAPAIEDASHDATLDDGMADDASGDAGTDAAVVMICGRPCVRRTCAGAAPFPGYCGFLDDGCGGVISCQDVCPAGQPCNGCVCGADAGRAACGDTPRTCAQALASCGTITDGVGNVLSCGLGCPTGMTCSARVANQCDRCPDPRCPPSLPDGGSDCTTAELSLDCGYPEGSAVCESSGGHCATCATIGASCGISGDGCGGILDCGTCPPRGPAAAAASRTSAAGQGHSPTLASPRRARSSASNAACTTTGAAAR